MCRTGLVAPRCATASSAGPPSTHAHAHARVRTRMRARAGARASPLRPPHLLLQVVAARAQEGGDAVDNLVKARLVPLACMAMGRTWHGMAWQAAAVVGGAHARGQAAAIRGPCAARVPGAVCSIPRYATCGGAGKGIRPAPRRQLPCSTAACQCSCCTYVRLVSDRPPAGLQYRGAMAAGLRPKCLQRLPFNKHIAPLLPATPPPGLPPRPLARPPPRLTHRQAAPPTGNPAC